jgi:hypothetical protein
MVLNICIQKTIMMIHIGTYLLYTYTYAGIASSFAMQ